MMRVLPNKGRLLAVLICAVLWLGWAPPAPGQAYHKLTFQEMVDKSDAIFTGTCVTKKAFMRNGGIVTHYEIQPSGFLKGQLPLNERGNVDMEERGGQLQGPVPLGQLVPGMADIAPNESVLLFTQNPPAPSAVAAKDPRMRNRLPVVDPASPRLVGRNQGHLTIFRHPETGVPLVARAAASNLPNAPSSPTIQTMMIAQNQKFAQREGKSTVDVTKFKSNSIAARALRASPRIAAKVDQAIAAGQKVRQKALAARKQVAADEVYQYESLDSVKARIQKMVQRPRPKP